MTAFFAGFIMIIIASILWLQKIHMPLIFVTGCIFVICSYLIPRLISKRYEAKLKKLHEAKMQEKKSTDSATEQLQTFSGTALLVKAHRGSDFLIKEPEETAYLDYFCHEGKEEHFKRFNEQFRTSKKITLEKLKRGQYSLLRQFSLKISVNKHLSTLEVFESFKTDQKQTLEKFSCNLYEAIVEFLRRAELNEDGSPTVQTFFILDTTPERNLGNKILKTLEIVRKENSKLFEYYIHDFTTVTNPYIDKEKTEFVIKVPREGGAH